MQPATIHRTGARTDDEAHVERHIERALELACADDPLAGADACVDALARALDAAQAPSAGTARACALLLAHFRAHSDDARAWRAIERIERIAAAHGAKRVVHPYVPAPALVLSVLWCIAHRVMLLPDERALDPDVGRSPGAWARIRAAAMRCDAEAIPLPVATAAAWSLDGDAPGAASLREGLRLCAPRLARMLGAVECAWGGAPCDAVCDKALREVVLVARLRRGAIDAGYRSGEHERGHLWFDLHQGARRPDTVERVALARRLRAMFERHADLLPELRTHLHLDRAVEHEALGENARARAALEAAVAMAAADPSSAPDERPRAHLAVWLWSQGDARGARRLLAGLGGDTARGLRRTLAEGARHRKALRRARRLAEGDGRVVAACRVAHAETRAGHLVAGERTARAVCERHPGEAPAWDTLARVLCAAGRFRDALDPARRALALAGACVETNALLARILACIGPEGREESAARAALALDANARRRVLDDDSLDELAAIARGRPLRTTTPETP